MDKFMEMIIFVLCLFTFAKAQTTTNQIDDEIQPLHPSTAVLLIALAIMSCILVAIVIYFKFCQIPPPNTLNSEPDHHVVISSSKPHFSGLDRTTIESLPFFTFSSLKGSKEGLECAVCLSRFEGDEVLRLLPKCSHAFHMACIDRWLEDHSSCPLCRNRLSAGDVKNAALTNLEFFIQREERQGRSSRFIQDSKMHKFRHKIIVSDVMHKSRWSDVYSSDMISLNAEMLNAMLLSSGRLTAELSAKEQILMIKEDLERKRLHDAKVVAKNGNNSGELSDGSLMFEALDPSQMRSMSEITNISRFSELDTSSTRTDGSTTQLNMEKDEKVRRLWLPIARRTINWFSDQQTSPNARKNALHV